MAHYTHEGLQCSVPAIPPSDAFLPLQALEPEPEMQYQIGGDAVSAAMQNQILIAAIEQAAVAIRHQGQGNSDAFGAQVDEWLQSLQQQGSQIMDPAHVEPTTQMDGHNGDCEPHHMHIEPSREQLHPMHPPPNLPYEPDHYRCTLEGVMGHSAGELNQNVRSVNCNAALREAALNSRNQTLNHFDQGAINAPVPVRIGDQKVRSAFIPPSDAVANISVVDSRKNRHLGGRLAKALHKTHVPTKSHKAVPSSITGTFTSMYRGVTRHRLTGRYEAHFWDSSYKRSTSGSKSKRTKGRQIYLGGYDDEITAARTYDKAVLAYLGTRAPTNFPLNEYTDFLASIQDKTPDEVVASLRRGSVGFSRGRSQYRGVTKPHATKAGGNKWEARMGRIDGNKYLYLGTYSTPEAAAKAYDRAIVKYKGCRAVTNFDISNYADILADPDAYDVVEAAKMADASLPQADQPQSEQQTQAPSDMGGFVSYNGGVQKQDGSQLSKDVVDNNCARGPTETTEPHPPLMSRSHPHHGRSLQVADDNVDGEKFWEEWHLAMEGERQRQRQREYEAALKAQHEERGHPDRSDPYHQHHQNHQQYQQYNHHVPMNDHTGQQQGGGMSRTDHQRLHPKTTVVEMPAGEIYDLGQRNLTGATACTPSHRRALSPLAACLLSPLGLLPDGAPKFKSDSPLAKLLASDDMARFLESLQSTDVGLVGPKLQPNPAHRVQYQAPGTAEELWNALAWLESVDVTQLGHN